MREKRDEMEVQPLDPLSIFDEEKHHDVGSSFADAFEVIIIVIPMMMITGLILISFSVIL